MKLSSLSFRRFSASLLIIVFLSVMGGTSAQAQETTTEPQPPPTETAIPTAEPAPETTATPDPTSEPTLEPTVPPTAEPTVEASETPQPTPAVNPFQIDSICTEQGAAFVITNRGPDMTEPAFYWLQGDFTPVPEPQPTLAGDAPADNADTAVEVDVPEAGDTPVSPSPELNETPVTASPEDSGTPFQLAAGESLTVGVGSGAGVMVIGETAYSFDAECASAPALSVNATCAFETGVTFTIANEGGTMSVEQAYSMSAGEGEPLIGAFLLGANETLDLAAGYGTPSLTSEDLTSALAEPCYAPAEVSGVVWVDLDGDGLRGENDTLLPGVTVQLVDTAGFALSFVTGSEGQFRFVLLPTATYTAQVDLESLPEGLEPAVEGGQAQTLDVLMGLTYTADFGFVMPATASVSGTVWLETGNFGVRDTGEMGVVGAQVELVDADGAVVATAPVDLVTGSYTFTELRAGDYTVRLAQETLFTPNGITWDSDGDFNYESAMTLMTGQALTGIDFGVVGTF